MTRGGLHGFNARPNHVVRHRRVVVRGVTTLGVLGLVLGVPLAMMGIHAPPPLEQIRNVTGHPGQLRRVLGERLGTRRSWGGRCDRLARLDVVRRLRHCGSGGTSAWSDSSQGARESTPSIIRGGSSRRLTRIWCVRSTGTAVEAARRRHVRVHPACRAPDQAAEAFEKARDTDRRRDRHRSSRDDRSSGSRVPLDRIYVVKPRDTLWSIAETELGSPLQWRRIAEANYGRRQR